MSEKLMTRREYRAIKVDADRKALHAKYFKPIKVVTVFSLAAALVAGGTVSAMAATTDPTVPSMDQPLTADQMLGTPTLGEALTADQMSAALAAAPYESVTGITGTIDGLNIDVNMSDPSTGLQVNTIADDGQGRYKIEVDATGASAGFWTNAVGDTYTSSAGTETATVTAINGNIVSLDITYSSVASVTPVFTASGSSTGPAAPVVPKTDPAAVNDAAVLDTTKDASVTADVLANDSASPGYVLDPTTLMLINPITGAPTTTQTGNATLTVVNGKIVVTAVPNWSGYSQGTYTAKEKWVGTGSEPAGWTPGTVTGTLQVQVIGAQAAPAPTATDCTVAAAPAGGTGFAVPFATSGSSGLTCNLVAVADSVSIAPDSTQGAVNVGANDTTTNSSYTIDPSIQFRAPDGSFAADVVYPNQYEVSYNSISGLTTVTRLGSYSGTPTILYRVSESKLDSNNNKLVGGSSSALITMDFAPLTTPETPETPVKVPETPVSVPVVPETPVTDPVVTDIGIAITDNTPAPAPVGNAVSRPFSNLGDTSASFGSDKAQAVVASATPQGLGNTVIGALGVGVLVLGLGAAGVVSISNARHRRSQKGDVAAY